MTEFERRMQRILDPYNLSTQDKKALQPKQDLSYPQFKKRLKRILDPPKQDLSYPQLESKTSVRRTFQEPSHQRPQRIKVYERAFKVLFKRSADWKKTKEDLKVLEKKHVRLGIALHNLRTDFKGLAFRVKELRMEAKKNSNTDLEYPEVQGSDLEWLKLHLDGLVGDDPGFNEVQWAVKEIKRLQEENDKLRNIEIIQEGSHIRITIGNSDALPLTIHKQPAKDLAIYPTKIEDKNE